jgi:hypothetical protein
MIQNLELMKIEIWILWAKKFNRILSKSKKKHKKIQIQKLKMMSQLFTNKNLTSSVKMILNYSVSYFQNNLSKLKKEIQIFTPRGLTIFSNKGLQTITEVNWKKWHRLIKYQSKIHKIFQSFPNQYMKIWREMKWISWLTQTTFQLYKLK